MRKKKVPKLFCEIENCPVTDPALIHKHHIIERTEVGTCNDDLNLALICANHHSLLHAGKLKIIGVFPSTGTSGRTLVYELNGNINVPGITEAYFKHKPNQMKISTKEDSEKK